MNTQKKLFSTIMSIIICFAVCPFGAVANSSDSPYNNGAMSHVAVCNHEVGEVEIHIVSTDFTEEQSRKITNILLNNQHKEQLTRNLICTLFGHDYESGIATITTHYVYPTYPKCKEEVYKVSICNRCDHSETELLNAVPVGCCP